jgi:methyl-accepting chemotaxis protein
MSVDSPARPAIPDPAPWLAGPAKGPRDRRGSRLALRNWRVPWRLIALIAIPTVMAMAFAGLRVAATASSAANFGRSAQLAGLGQQVTGLAQAMEDERDLSANFIADGRPAADRATLRRQYAVTNAWAQRVGAQMREVGGAFPAQTRAGAAAVIARIADLPNLRSYAMTGNAPALTVITNYTLALADLFTIDDAIAQQAGSSALVARVRTLGSLSRMKGQASLQRAIVEAALVSGQFQPGTLDALTTAQTQQATDLASFGTSATLAETQAFNNTVAGRPIDLAQAMEQRAIVLGGGGSPLQLGPGATQQWYTDMSYTIGRMRQVERQLADAIALQASALHRGAMRSLLLTAAIAVAVLIVVLLATVIIARSLVRPLRQLKAGALEVAEVRLPEEVRELSTAGEADQSVEVEPIGVHSSDEIGQVARAFDQVHQEAVRLAADEARLRGSVSAMFISLSRRSGSLLERLLRLIDSLELGEQDSERLADLFRMDHLATRMRRNSENLLVLAGQEPPRRWAEPVSLPDVARASVSEIEQYERVVLDLQPGLGVAGNAVADIVHLLAEIIENSTTFSQKSTHVTVSGHSLRSGGVLINVIDSGMGMTEEQLAVVNWRLENPPAADVEVSRHMGLFAVAHLADRHGIRVRLRKATGAGLIAHVWLPEALVSHDSKPTSWDRIRTERASAVIQAVTRAARFSQDPAAAVALAEAPFAAAPLAEAPFTTTPPGEAPAATAPATTAPAAEPPAAALRGESATAAPPGEAWAITASPGGAAPGEAPAVAAPAGEAPGAPQAGAQQVVVPEPLQRPREIRLPIFESVESDWFRARRRPPPRAGVPLDPHRAAPSWESPSDEGWQAAETVLTPAVGGITASGLPRRTPKANLVPGSAGIRENRPARAANSAEAISSRLAGFQQGSRRARAAARGAHSPDEQP